MPLSAVFFLDGNECQVLSEAKDGTAADDYIVLAAVKYGRDVESGNTGIIGRSARLPFYYAWTRIDAHRLANVIA